MISDTDNSKALDKTDVSSSTVPKKLIRKEIIHKLKVGEWEFVEDKDELNRLYAIKLREELAEIQASRHKDIFEFVDLIQVAFSFAKQNGFTHEQIASALIEKTVEKGNFSNIALNNLNPTNPSNYLYFAESQEKTILTDYMHEFAFEFGRLWNTELSYEDKMKRISEKIKMPEEVILDFFKRFLIGTVK